MNEGASDSRIVLSIDAMGGDHGPAAIVAGMSHFAKRNDQVQYIVHGDKAELKRLVRRHKSLANICDIRHAEGVVTMEDKPSQIVRSGKSTSMWAALESVKQGEAGACVSCGNTGALMALSMFRLRKLEGVNRPAIAILWPSRNASGFNIMLDVGADIRADADDLLKYALMGVSYARNGMGLTRPRVGLLNVGTEENKGNAILKDAHDLIEKMSESADFDFGGFVEGGDIPGDRVDVIVTDGFTGNIALKTGEGTATLISDFLREAFKYSPMSRLAAMLGYTSLNRLKKRIDPRRVNGGVFLGLNGTVVKSHGSADKLGVSSAIKLAFELENSGITEKIKARVASAAHIQHDTPTGT